MYRDHSIGVVVPAYNEEGFVGEVIDTMPEYVDRVYVIDDCSTDGTWEEIRTHAERANNEGRKKNKVALTDNTKSISQFGGNKDTETNGGVVSKPRVKPIQHDENRGVGGAIKTGYLHALEDGIDITAVMGGDGQMDPDILPEFLDPIVEGEADYAKGNRLLYKEYRSDMPKFRFIGNAILTLLTKIASGYWKTMDPQNGYTTISHYALENVGVNALYEYYGYCNDLLVKLNAKGMRVADVAMPAKYGTEESSIRYRTYMPKLSWLLLKNFLWRLKVKYLILDFHPLALFYYFGGVSAFIGILGIGWSLYSKIVFVDPLFVRATSSLLVFMMGSMFLMFAMLFDMEVNENKEVQIRDQI